MKWIRLLLIATAVLIGLLVFSFKDQLPGPIENADMYIVEAWIPPSLLEYTADYLVKNNVDSAYIVGVGTKPLKKKARDFRQLNCPINLISNGYLMLNAGSGAICGDSILIDVEASSVNNIGAFILLFANDTLIDQRIINGRDSIHIHCKNKLERLTVYFANDAYCSKKEDRNLRIHAITSNKGEYELEKRYGGVHILPEKLAMTNAKKAQFYLEELASNKICYERIERNTNVNNKTLQASLLFKEWLAKRAVSNKKLKVNIITSKNHSRRTYINYKNALEPYAEVGIITPDKSNSNCNASTIDRKLIGWLDETASTVYSSIYWMFW